MPWSVHAAFGGSTNLILHLPAIAHAAGLRRPDRRAIGRASTARCPGWSTRCPTALAIIPTVQVFLAGGVPEVMLHLRDAGVLDTRVLTVERANARRAAERVGSDPSAGPRSAASCASATASIRTT